MYHKGVCVRCWTSAQAENKKKNAPLQRHNEAEELKFGEAQIDPVQLVRTLYSFRVFGGIYTTSVTKARKPGKLSNPYWKQSWIENFNQFIQCSLRGIIDAIYNAQPPTHNKSVLGLQLSLLLHLAASYGLRPDFPNWLLFIFIRQENPPWTLPVNTPSNPFPSKNSTDSKHSVQVRTKEKSAVMQTQASWHFANRSGLIVRSSS